MRALHFFAAIELPEARAEAEDSVAEISAAASTDLNAVFAASALNLMLGRPDRAREPARSFLRQQGVFSGFLTPAVPLRVVRFLAGDLEEEELLREAPAGQARELSEHFVGLRHLARGDRATARIHFRRSAEAAAGDSGTKAMSNHILRRMAEDPHWPPTIPPLHP